MFHKTLLFANSIAILVLAGALAPTTASAGPVGNLMHPYFASKAPKDATVEITLHNKGKISQDIKVNDKLYTVKPDAFLTIKAPAGTPVYAATAGDGYKQGDVLVSITPELKGGTVGFN